MKKMFSAMALGLALLMGVSAEAATSGKTDMNSSCTVNIASNWMKKGGKVKVTIMDNRNWNMGGMAEVYIYDEVRVLMKKQVVKGSATISLPWTRHKWYTLKFKNYYSGSNPKYYNSVKWKVGTVLGGNARIE